MALKVTAGAIVVPVKGADRYLYRGAILPDGVESADVKRLKSIGLVTEVKVQTRPKAEADPKADDSKADPKAGDSKADPKAGDSKADPKAGDSKAESGAGK